MENGQYQMDVLLLLRTLTVLCMPPNVIYSYTKPRNYILIYTFHINLVVCQTEYYKS